MQELNEVEMFRSVLNEMLGELKQLHQSTKETNKTIITLSEKVEGFDKRLEDLQVVAPLPDLGPVNERLAEGVSGLHLQMEEGLTGIQRVFTSHLQKLTAVLEAEPKPIVRRISLFPEKDYHGNYKYFIRAFCLWTLGALALVMIFKLVEPYFDKSISYQEPVYRSTPHDGSVTAPPAPRHVGKGGHKRRTIDPVVEGRPGGSDSVGSGLGVVDTAR